MKFFAIIILTSMCLCLGCGGDGRPELVAIDGTLTLDGEPLDGALVAFIPDAANEIQRGSKGFSASGGKLVVGTYAADDGLPIGKYKVTVIKEELKGDVPEDFNMEDPSQNLKPVKSTIFTPLHYSNPEETDLVVEVTKDGMSPSTIALEGGSGPITKTLGGRPADEP